MTTNRKQTGLRVPVELLDKITAEAERNGMSLNAYLLMLIRLGRAQLKGQGHASSHTQQQSA